MQKLISIILVALFLNSSCFQRETEAVNFELGSPTLVQATIPELTFLKTEGFSQNANFKVVHQLTGCFQYKARTIEFKKLTNGYYVASYSEYDGSERTGAYLTKNLNGDFITDMNNFVGQCKEMNDKIWKVIPVEKKGDVNKSFIFGQAADFSTNHEQITIDDGLNYKIYSINDKAGPNPFNVFMQKIIFEK